MTKAKEQKFTINIDRKRDNLLTNFGKEVLKDRYLINNETYQDLFARVSSYYADDEKHANRIYDYISNLWFISVKFQFSSSNMADYSCACSMLYV